MVIVNWTWDFGSTRQKRGNCYCKVVLWSFHQAQRKKKNNAKESQKSTTPSLFSAYVGWRIPKRKNSCFSSDLSNRFFNNHSLKRCFEKKNDVSIINVVWRPYRIAHYKLHQKLAWISAELCSIQWNSILKLLKQRHVYNSLKTLTNKNPWWFLYLEVEKGEHSLAQFLIAGRPHLFIRHFKRSGALMQDQASIQCSATQKTHPHILSSEK